MLNLVESGSKSQLFAEILRVLRPGGRAVISDIVSDEVISEELQRDPELWSGCISGAMTETAFLESFERAGFYGVELVKRERNPWRTVEGIEFRSVTVRAFKGKPGVCFERNQAVIYKGPFKQVVDDDGHRLWRGVRHAVCDKTYQRYRQLPYRDYFEFIDPLTPVPLTEAKPFDCHRTAPRQARETKGEDHRVTTGLSACCHGDNETVGCR